jgi:hypothetical protein
MSDLPINPITHDGPIRNDEVRCDDSKPKFYCHTVDPESETVCSCEHLLWHDGHYPYCALQKSTHGREPIPGYRWSQLLQLQDTKPNPECPRLANVLDLLPEIADAH